MSALKALQVERKFGASLSEILGGMVEQGLSIRQMSERTTFAAALVSRMLETLGLRDQVQSGTYRTTPAREAAMARVGEQNTKYRAHWRGETASVHSHCKRHGIPTARVYRAIWDGATPVEALEMAVGGGE